MRYLWNRNDNSSKDYFLAWKYHDIRFETTPLIIYNVTFVEFLRTLMSDACGHYLQHTPKKIIFIENKNIFIRFLIKIFLIKWGENRNLFRIFESIGGKIHFSNFVLISVFQFNLKKQNLRLVFRIRGPLPSDHILKIKIKDVHSGNIWHFILSGTKF